MSAFQRMPVTELPDRALGSTDALYLWAQPLMLRCWTAPYWHSVYFLLAFKSVVTLITTVLMIRLFCTGEFWIIRLVRVSRGRILVPKATDTTLFLGACFISVDALFRVKALQWFKGPTYAPLRHYTLFEGLRVGPAWLGAWSYLCASSLVWPLDVQTIRPLVWHLGFLGVPALASASLIPALVLADREVDKAQAVYLSLERVLLDAPSAPLTQWMEEQAILFHSYCAEAAYYSGCAALVGAFWIAVVVIGEVIVGLTLLSRVFKAYSRIPTYAAGHHTWSVLDASGEGSGSVSQPQREQLQKIGWLRMAKYLAGIAPLATAAPELPEPLPPAIARRVLRSFFVHTFTEIFSLCAMQVVVFCVVVLMATRTYIETRENVYDATYGNGFMRTTFAYHMTELFSLAVFGTPLTISMLKRQVYPLQVYTSAKQSSKPIETHRPTTTMAPEEQTGDTGISIARTRRKRSLSSLLSLMPSSPIAWPVELTHLRSARNRSINDWPTELAGESPTTPTHSLRSAASSGPVTSSSCLDSEPTRIAPTSNHEGTPLSRPAFMMEDDVSWYAGRMGRSIVLQALASGEAYDQSTKSAWRTNGPNHDVEGHAMSQHKFATPHGIIGGASPPLSPTPAVPPSPPPPKKGFGFRSASSSRD